MSAEGVRAADELEALRQLKARGCRFLDTKDAKSWRRVFTADVVVTLDLTVSTDGADPMTTPSAGGLKTELTLTSATTATGIRVLEDWLVFGDGRELQNLSCHG